MPSIGKYRRIRISEEFEGIIEKLRRDSENGIPIIVEGERDVRSLRILGITGEIIPVKSIRWLRKRIETKSIRSVILLFDLDREGERMMKIVKRALEGAVAEINIRYWLSLKTFKKLGFTQIEHLHLVPGKIQVSSPSSLYRDERTLSRRRLD